MLTPRAIRGLLGRFLPEAVKAPLRGRLFGYRAAAVDLGFRVREEGTSLLVSLDGVPRLLAPPEAREDLAYHFRDNGASVEEMHGFLRAAREAGGLLFDVGAHRGLFSAVFSLARPENRAVGYEPSPSLARDAEWMAEANGLGGRMTVRAAAVGAAPGRTRAATDAMGLIRLDPSPGEETFDLEVVSLDAECARLGADPDVVKVDVEGAEAEVLRGAAGLLRRRRPLLFLEFHLDELERRGERPEAMLDVLRAYGYSVETPLGKRLAPAAIHASAGAVVRFVARAP
ncbi:MAG TPA: FkbM family methyltransferase [Longimicrobium sp.]|nr:FkbM family methyltransferase [Longimicrobium sp.]